MLSMKKLLILVINLYGVLVHCDVLEKERGTFLAFTHVVPVTGSALEVVEQLQQAVKKEARGERRVRRYFDSYDTPFIGITRREFEKKEELEPLSKRI